MTIDEFISESNFFGKYKEVYAKNDNLPAENTLTWSVEFGLLWPVKEDSLEYFANLFPNYVHNGRFVQYPFNKHFANERFSHDSNTALARLFIDTNLHEEYGFSLVRNAFINNYAFRLWDLCYYAFADKKWWWFLLTPTVILHDAWSAFLGTFIKDHNDKTYIDTDGKLLCWIRGYKAKHWFWRFEYKFMQKMMQIVLKTKTPYRKCRKIYFKMVKNPVRIIGDHVAD